MNPNITTVVGLQYGDEGKGRIVDNLLSNKKVLVVRFNGGSNAGHTVIVDDKKFELNQVPSGLLHPHAKLYIASGCVLNPVELIEEINILKKMGVDIRNKLKISPYITLVQPHQMLLDSILMKSIGTTNRGIGPAYSGQAERTHGRRLKNIRVADYIVEPGRMEDAVKENIDAIVKRYKLNYIDSRKQAREYTKAIMLLKPFISKNKLIVIDSIKRNQLLFEGAQSVMLDVITGTVPYVTSSRTLAGTIHTGGELYGAHNSKVIGVAKVIMTRLGNGPFVTEIGGKRSEEYCCTNRLVNIKNDEFKKYDPLKSLKSDDDFEVGIGFRMLTNEYGATKEHPPRRMGMLDLVMLRDNCRMNSVTEIVLTKMDMLNIFSKTKIGKIPVAIAYKVNGKKLDHMPTTLKELQTAKPVYKYLAAIKEDLSKFQRYEDIPNNAKYFIKYVEQFTKTKVVAIGVGPERNKYIKIK